MSYADGLLSTGERILYRNKQHPFIFIWGARYAILAVVIALVAARGSAAISTRTASAGTLRELLGWVTAVLFIGGIAVVDLDRPALHQPGVRADQPAGHPGRRRAQPELRPTARSRRSTTPC